MKIHKCYKFYTIYLIFFIVLISFIINFKPNHSYKINNCRINDYTSVINIKNVFPIYTQEWYKWWEGIYSAIGEDIALDSKFNIYLVGYTSSSSGNYDAFIVKYNSSGIQIWNRTWGGSGADEALGVVVDQNDYIYVTGATTSFGAGYNDIFLIKFSSNGTELWNLTWGGSSDDVAETIAHGDDCIYLAGYSGSFSTGDATGILIKFNSSGIQDWNLSWNGISRDISVDCENNIYLTGYTAILTAGSNDAYIAKYNSSGTLLWNKTWGGAKWDEGACITVDRNNNIYLSGISYSWSPDPLYSDIFLIKYDSQGNKIWQTIWGGFYHDRVFDIVVDNYGYIYLTGELFTYSYYRDSHVFTLTESFDAFVIKYDSGGNEIGHRIWGGTGLRDRGNGIAIDNNGNCYIAGETWIETENYGFLPNAFVFKCSLFNPGHAPQFEWLFLMILIEIICLTIIEIRYFKTNEEVKT